MSEDRCHIGNLGLSIRTYNLLANAGIMYVEQLQQATDDALRVIPKFGTKSLNEVRRALRKREWREKYHARELPPVASGGEADVYYDSYTSSIYPAYSGLTVHIDGGYAQHDYSNAGGVELDPRQALDLLAWLEQEKPFLQQKVEEMSRGKD